MSFTCQYPKLRDALDVRPLVQDGRPCILLRDPLQLTGKTLVVPQPLGLVLALCDGTRQDASALSASVAVRHGMRVSADLVERLLAALDDALLLDNANFASALSSARAEYMQAPCRALALASSLPDELRSLLDGYLQTAQDADQAPLFSLSSEIRGLVSPHIDYERGGLAYAQVWKQAAQAVRAADLAVILGTDHYGPEAHLTLTRQNYATPLGVLPTARNIVDALAEAIGADKAFAGELYHRSEHSVELAAVWLHHIRDGHPCELVPILCGSFDRFIGGQAAPDDELNLDELIAVFKQATAGKRVIVVAAADLAHVGPAFGGQPLDRLGRARLQAADDELIERICAGDAEGFLSAIRRVGDRNGVCGVPPIYVALRLLAPVQGARVAYERCLADEAGTSLVSVCGVVWS